MQIQLASDAAWLLVSEHPNAVILASWVSIGQSAHAGFVEQKMNALAVTVLNTEPGIKFALRQLSILLEISRRYRC